MIRLITPPVCPGLNTTTGLKIACFDEEVAPGLQSFYGRPKNLNRIFYMLNNVPQSHHIEEFGVRQTFRQAFNKAWVSVCNSLSR